MGKNSRNVRSSQSTKQVHLSGSQIRHLAKPRAGFEGPAQQLLAVLLEQPDLIVPKGFDVTTALAKVAQYQAMTPMVRNKKLDYESAADTQLQLGSEIWLLVLSGYQHAKVAARSNPAIAAAIAPFEAFMKKRHGRRKAKTTSTPATPVAA
jgi:hypothetical protein